MKKEKTRDKAMLTNKVEGLMSIPFPYLRSFYKRIISRHLMHKMQHGYLKFDDKDVCRSSERNILFLSA